MPNSIFRRLIFLSEGFYFFSMGVSTAIRRLKNTTGNFTWEKSNLYFFAWCLMPCGRWVRVINTVHLSAFFFNENLKLKREHPFPYNSWASKSNFAVFIIILCIVQTIIQPWERKWQPDITISFIVIIINQLCTSGIRLFPA